jgi:putative ABC transport system permease protein
VLLLQIAKPTPDIGGDALAKPALVDAPAPGRWRPGMVWLLAWRNLVSDRVRFIATLVGIAFSVVLMAVQLGLLIGFADTASALVNHAGADFWVASRGTSNVDQALPLPERWRFKALSVPDVAAVDRLLVQFAPWTRPDGGSEYVIIVGFDLDAGTGGPWNVVDGSVSDLRIPDAVMLDRIYAEKLGIRTIGQTVEIGIHGSRARVVGFTEGIRAFTQSPYVFTSFKNAHRFARYEDDRTTYLLVRAAPGSDRAALLNGLRAALPVTDVWPASTFASMTANYWLLTTGAGLAMLVGAALGIVVGIAIVAQTLYAATVERLSEYATLVAIGAPNRYLNQIVLWQGLISGIFGYAIGLAVAVLVVHAAADSTASLVLPWQLAVAVGFVALVMCVIASFVAIHKIKTIDPTAVFR